MDRRNRSSLTVSRRESLRLSMGLVVGALGAWGTPPQAQAGGEDFSHLVESFRAQAEARGVSDATYTHVMHGLKPDTEVFDLQRDQPEFSEKRVESSYGDPDVQRNHMRPIFPALAALAWGEPRRRHYWEKELLNVLVIVERGWSTPEEIRGSWAGAMGHTLQRMLGGTG